MTSTAFSLLGGAGCTASVGAISALLKAGYSPAIERDLQKVILGFMMVWGTSNTERQQASVGDVKGVLNIPA